MTTRKTVRIAFASLLLLAASFAAPAASAQTPPASPSKEGNSTGVALQQRGLRGPGAELERRIRGRGTDAEEAIQRRLARALEELAAAAEFDAVLVNDHLEAAGEELERLMGLAPASAM